MKQFSLEKYLADPTRKVVTRDGRDVRIICTDRDSLFPVVFLIRKEADAAESVFSADKYGICSVGIELCEYDLFFAPNKQSRWVFLYRDLEGMVQISAAYTTNKSAKFGMSKHINAFALTEITWEE